MALGPARWSALRSALQRLLAAQEGALRDSAALREAVLVPQANARMHLPAAIGDYTDFYCSLEHATNCGVMFRGSDNPLQPNWRHLPVAYHSRSSSIVVSGSDVRRPWGQVHTTPGQGPQFQPSARLDFELELVGGAGHCHWVICILLSCRATGEEGAQQGFVAARCTESLKKKRLGGHWWFGVHLLFTCILPHT